MTIITITFLNAVSLFLGYATGRIGHVWINVWIGDPSWLPHHWIYGLFLMAVAFWFFPGIWGPLVFSFGLGHFISDLKDFWELKFFSPDGDGKKRFWSID